MAAVLVHIDLEAGRPDASSLVALAAGRAVASSWGAVLYAAAIIGVSKAAPGLLPGLDIAEAELARGGADKILVATTRAPMAPLWASLGTAWQGVLDQLRPRLVLFGADAPSAPELAPRTAARIGARLLARARAGGLDEVELRDREGGYARANEGGAAVALVGRADPMPPSAERVEVVVLPPTDGDPRLEVVATTAAEVAHTHGVVIAIGDDVVDDREVVANAKRLAALVGGQLVGNAGAGRTGAIASGATVERTTPLAPELLVTIGGAQLDVAGATSVVQIGAMPSKLVDGALPGPAASGLAELLARLVRT